MAHLLQICDKYDTPAELLPSAKKKTQRSHRILQSASIDVTGLLCNTTYILLNVRLFVARDGELTLARRCG